MFRRGLALILLALFAQSPLAHADDATDRQTAINAAQSFAVSRLPSLPSGSILKIRQVDFDTCLAPSLCTSDLGFY